MEQNNYNSYNRPQEQNRYQNGSTKPPKNHGGLIAVLLMLVIVLGGISSALGVLNIRLSAQLDGDPSAPVLFSPADSHNPTTSTGGTEASTPAGTGEQLDLQLNKTPESVENVPQNGGLSLQDIYEKNIPSVVSISCALERGSSTGTGVVLSENGYLVTNCHVVEGAKSIQVRFTDQRVLPAAVVGCDGISDLAVLQVNADNLTPAEFGDSSSLRVGDAVVAIGDPLGQEFRGTMTDGIVSAINRQVQVSGRAMTLIQTNAALNSGNSGGPLINCYGQVIGINTMKISAFVDDAGVEGLGFAIPSTTVKEIVDQLIGQGYVSGRPSLGFTGETIPVSYQLYYRLPAGFYITQVTPGSSAQENGIEAGDVLLQLNGQRITDADQLSQVLYNLEAGEQVELVIYRNRKQHTVTLTLGQQGDTEME